MRRSAAIPVVGTLFVVIVCIIALSGFGAILVLTEGSSSLPSSSSIYGSSRTSTTTSAGSNESNALLADCSHVLTPSFGFGTLVAETSSPALICVQIYYYNSTAPTTLNVSSMLSVEAVQYIQSGTVLYPRSFNGVSNFTVATSQDEIVLGGPANENEGAVVTYAVTAIAGASGTYQLGFIQSSSLGTWMLASNPEQCAYYGELVAGNGQPNYAQQLGGCITYNTTYFTTTTVSGITYPLLTNNIYFRILGVTNSTQ